MNGSEVREFEPTEKPMYRGTLIEELMATVERAECSSRLDRKQESALAYWYAVAQKELANLDVMHQDAVHDSLAGVA